MSNGLIGLAALLMIGLPLITILVMIDTRRRMKAATTQVEQRLQTLLKGVYHNTKDIRSNQQTLDQIRGTSETSLDLQRKSLEHQKILLASLTRQSRHLMEMIAPPSTSSATPATNKVRRANAGARHMRIAGQDAGRHDQLATPLHDLILRKSEIASSANGEARKQASLSAYQTGHSDGEALIRQLFADGDGAITEKTGSTVAPAAGSIPTADDNSAPRKVANG